MRINEHLMHLYSKHGLAFKYVDIFILTNKIFTIYKSLIRLNFQIKLQ